jgi:heme oxygenase (mycobilin-producing)
MSEVVLINPFEVPDDKVDALLVGWERAAAFMREQPGFRSTALHRALTAEARFAFVNVAGWATPQHFADAVKRMPALTDPEIRFYPGLYRVVREVG